MTTLRLLSLGAGVQSTTLALMAAPIDRTTRAERIGWQTDIFDHLEDGDPDGCSPYGCRSGDAVLMVDTMRTTTRRTE